MQYIGGKKIIKLGRSRLQNQEIERQSISNIRSMAKEIESLMNDISLYTPSMVSPGASPIKAKQKSSTSHNYSQLQQFIDIKMPKQEVKERRQTITTQPTKKKSITSVHFTNYMKPIGKVSEKMREIIEKERQLRQQQEQKKLIELQKEKEKSLKAFKEVQPRYQTYENVNLAKQEAIVCSRIEKQEKEMSQVTFSPNINKNFQINEPFEMRLETNKIKKQQKQSNILKNVMKDQTYKPKLNTNNKSQSKIKKLWNSSLKISSFNEQSFTIGESASLYEPNEEDAYRSVNSLKLSTPHDMNFFFHK